MAKRFLWLCDRDGKIGITASGEMPMGWINTPVGDICSECKAEFLSVMASGNPANVVEKIHKIDSGLIIAELKEIEQNPI